VLRLLLRHILRFLSMPWVVGIHGSRSLHLFIHVTVNSSVTMNGDDTAELRNH